jgi:hypothetical protein
MQISAIINRNLEKPSRNPSNRNILPEKKLFDGSLKKFGSAYAQSLQKCSNIQILAKIEGKEQIFCRKIDQGHIRFWFR